LETTVSVVVGDGRTSLFWSNKWINKYIIHLIAVLASQQDVSMSEHINCMSKLKAGKFALFVWLISHQPIVLFSQNKLAISNQPAVLFSQNRPAPAISHQLNEQADKD
jgi:hypothetical protein